MSSYCKSAPGTAESTFDQWEVGPRNNPGLEAHADPDLLHIFDFNLFPNMRSHEFPLMFSTGSGKDAFCEGLRLTDGLAHMCAGRLLCRR